MRVLLRRHSDVVQWPCQAKACELLPGAQPPAQAMRQPRPKQRLRRARHATRESLLDFANYPHRADAPSTAPSVDAGSAVVEKASPSAGT